MEVTRFRVGDVLVLHVWFGVGEVMDEVGDGKARPNNGGSNSRHNRR